MDKTTSAAISLLAFFTFTLVAAALKFYGPSVAILVMAGGFVTTTALMILAKRSS